MNPGTISRLLGGLTPRQFLAQHWQKKPLLIRGALPGFAGPLTRAAVLRLAQSPELESRLVARSGSRWTLTQGPLTRAALAALPARNWTLLVQGLNHALPAADELLQRFDFIPYARLDDVMVSYAAPGGGVGPHLDSYDVFLLQGAGRRRWRIGPAGQARFRDDVPLKILRGFKPREEWVLDPGDMLYLPPGYAHEGTALEECFTYSIGFRLASHQELAQRFLDYQQDRLLVEGRLRDPDLQPTARPGAIPASLIGQAQSALAALTWNRATVADFLGRELSEPKPQVLFSPPAPAMDSGRFAAALRRHGVHLDGRSRMLYHGGRVYLNGEAAVSGLARTDMALLRRLADRRRLPPGAACSAALRKLLRSWYVYGYLHIDGANHS
jgi:50S ribosomal protein L16 3-hydroxylase